MAGVSGVWDVHVIQGIFCTQGGLTFGRQAFIGDGTARYEGVSLASP